MSLQDIADRFVKSNGNGSNKVAPVLKMTNSMGEDIDWSGLSSLKMRLQLGSADELTLVLPALDNESAWRPDMGLWQKGAVLYVELGYDGVTVPIQEFTIVGTTNAYADDAASMTIRGVSQLARALHNKDPRTYTEKNDGAVLDDICSTYGWTNLVDPSKLTNSVKRVKKKGDTDLKLLRAIASEARLGGPTVDVWGNLLMPEPITGAASYTRGPPETAGAEPILSFQPSREGGGDSVQLQITAWDPEREKFIDVIYKADDFANDPEIVFEGPASKQPIPTESSTRGLTLAVLAVRGYGNDAKKDVLSSGRLLNEDNVEDIARRWFDLQEKMSRWATIEVGGDSALAPYIAVNIEGQIANMDRGLWLPTVVEHTLDSGGWKSRLTATRVLGDTTVSSEDDADAIIDEVLNG